MIINLKRVAKIFTEKKAHPIIPKEIFPDAEYFHKHEVLKQQAAELMEDAEVIE